MAREQLTLEVAGGLAEDEPLVGSVKISGALDIDRDLARDERVRVHLIADGGEVVAEGWAICSAIAFKLHRKNGEALTERIHTAKVVEELG